MRVCLVRTVVAIAAAITYLAAGVASGQAEVDSTSKALARKLAGHMRIDYVYVNGVLVEDTPEFRLSLTDSTKRAEVIQYLDQIFIHGVPYHDARALGPEAGRILEYLLESESHREWRPTIVATIAYLEGRRGFQVLERFTRGRFWGEVDIHTFQALTSAQSVMGAIQDAEVVDYLTRGTNPAAWRDIKWTFGTYRGAELHLLLSKVAINGLGLTGSARASKVLETLRKSPHSPKQLSNIREAIVRNEAVRKMGIAEYMRLRDESAGQR